MCAFCKSWNWPKSKFGTSKSPNGNFEVSQNLQKPISCKFSVADHFHVNRKFTLKSNFRHFMESRSSSVLGCDFPFTYYWPKFSNFTRNHTKVGKFLTKNHNKWWNLSFTDFTFHANGEKWNTHSPSIHENFEPNHQYQTTCSPKGSVY